MATLLIYAAKKQISVFNEWRAEVRVMNAKKVLTKMKLSDIPRVG